MGTFALVGEVAEGASNVVTSTDFQPILTSLQSQFNVSTVVGVLALGVGGAAGLAFTYWAGRKLIGMLMSAFKKGKVSM